MNRMISILIGLLMAAGVAGGQTVRLHSAAMVGSADVRLADVAELTGLDGEAGKIALLKLDDPGDGRRLGIGQVQAALRNAGVNVAPVSFTGAAWCDVRRVFPAAVPERPVEKPVKVEPVAALAGAVPADPANTTQAGSLSHAAGTFGRLVIENVARELGVSAGDVSVAFEDSSRSRADSAATGLETISSTDRNRLGRRRWRAVVVDRGRRYTRYLSGVVSVRREVVVAARDIAAGATIDSADLATQTLTDDGSSDAMTDIEAVIGQQPAQAIQAGRIIPAAQLTAPILVRRGQAMNVAFKAGRLSVTLTGTALTDGRLGQRIQVERMRQDPKTNRRVRSRMWIEVTGPATGRVAAEAE